MHKSCPDTQHMSACVSVPAMRNQQPKKDSMAEATYVVASCLRLGMCLVLHLMHQPRLAGSRRESTSLSHVHHRHRHRHRHVPMECVGGCRCRRLPPGVYSATRWRRRRDRGAVWTPKVHTASSSHRHCAHIMHQYYAIVFVKVRQMT